MGFAAYAQDPLAVNFRRRLEKHGDMGAGTRIARFKR